VGILFFITEKGVVNLEDMMELYNKKIDPSKPGIYLIEEEKPAAEIKNTAGAPRVSTPGSATRPGVIDIIDRFLARPPGLQWPWPELSKLNEIDIGGITTVIAGTSHGKTAVALNLALHFIRQGKRILLWSGEMDIEMLVAKILCLQAGMGLKQLERELRDFRAGLPVAPELYHSVNELQKLYNKLWVESSWNLSKCPQVLELADDVKPDIIIVDYAQQLQPGPNKFRTRDEEIEMVMRSLNKYANLRKIAVIVLAQINREAKNIEKPALTGIRHSATIEQYSVNVLGVWNSAMALTKGSVPAMIDGWYWASDADTTKKAIAVAEIEGKSLTELIILKSRYHGNTGKAVPLLFHGPTGILEDFPVSSSGKSIQL
jgi:DNA primase